MTTTETQLLSGEQLAELTASKNSTAARAFLRRARRDAPHVVIRRIGAKLFREDVVALLNAAAEARALRPAAAALRAARG